MSITARILELRPPRIALGLTLAAAMLHYALPAQSPALPSSVVIAASFAVIGFGVMLRAWWLFKLRGTAICPTSIATRLVTDDIFSLSRNPMYLGMLMMMLGLAVGVGSIPYYAAALTLFIILNNAFCPFEEQKLAAGFGDAYEAYRSTVRRWL